jgi:hypothetical protein
MSAIGRARLTLSNEQLAALGEIAAESAHLESAVDLMIQVVLKISPEEFDVLINNRMLGAKVDVLKTCGAIRLAGKKRKKRRNQFTALMDHIKFLISQRAIAIHGIWGPEGGMKLGDLVAFWAGAGSAGAAEAKHKKGAMKAAQLEKLAEQFNQAVSDLWAFARNNWLFRRVKKKAEA